MNYYKLKNDKLEITNSSVELPSPWIEYEVGQEPNELIEALDAEQKVSDEVVKINQAFEYLKETDFYYPRQLEIGEDVPSAVVAKRAEAREFLRSKGY
jgi:hypothetical protein